MCRVPPRGIGAAAIAFHHRRRKKSTGQHKRRKNVFWCFLDDSKLLFQTKGNDTERPSSALTDYVPLWYFVISGRRLDACLLLQWLQ